MKQNIFKICTISIISLVILIGCGGGGSSSSLSSIFSGIAIDPEIQGATVFLDTNENGIFDSGELSTTTDNLGKYSLNIPSEDIGKPIVITGGIDRVTKENFVGTLSAITTSSITTQNITPLTTIVQMYKKENSSKTIDEVKSELATKLGINADDFDKNTVDVGNENLLQIALRIQKSIESIQSNSSRSTDELYKTLVTKLQTDANISAAIDSVIDTELIAGTLSYLKAKDLDKELRNIDIGTLTPEELTLTIDNIDANISSAIVSSDLDVRLYDDTNLRIEDDAELKTEQGIRLLKQLGLDDLDDATKNAILDNNIIDLENALISDIKTIIDSGDLNLSENLVNDIKKENFFNNAGLKNLDDITKAKLETAFYNVGFDFNTSTDTQFQAKLNDSSFFGDDDFQAIVQGQINKENITEVTSNSALADGKQIVGSIIKGAIDNATIKLLDSNNRLITSTISSKGIFVLPQITLSSNYYVIESINGTYEDEATSTTVDMNSSQGLKTILSQETLQTILNNKEFIAITPETTILTELVLNSVNSNTSSTDLTTAINNAKTLISKVMIEDSSPMSSIDGDIFLQVGDFTSAFPKDATESFARNRAISFSYMIRDLNLTAIETFDILDKIITDLKDGTSNGITVNSKDINITTEFALARTNLFQDTTTKLQSGTLSDTQKEELKAMGFDITQFNNDLSSQNDDLSSQITKYLASTTLPTLNILTVIADEDGDTNDTKATYTLTANKDVNVTISTPDGSWITPMWRYNNNPLPVVIKTSRDNNMTLILNNKLDSNSTIHWHGFKIPALMDGGPDIPVESDTNKTYNFVMNQPAAPLWFHPHPDMQTGKQVYMGLAGVYLLEDNISKALENNKQIPSGTKDTILLVQDRRFDGSIGDSARNLQYMNEDMDMDGMLGDTILVNGSVVPKQEVSNTKYRYRLYNVSNARTYDFALSDDSNFTVIATDGGFLKNPVTINHIVLGAAQRVEIVIDFAKYSTGDKVMLISKPFSRSGMSMMGMDGAIDTNSGISRMARMQECRKTKSMFVCRDEIANDTSGTNTAISGRVENGAPLSIMRFDITSNQTEDITLYTQINNSAEISTRIDENTASNVGNEREFLMSMDMSGTSMSFVINGKTFKTNRVDELITSGATEIWSIRNMSPMAHPFHAHATQYLILTRNGVPASGVDLGWKDTFLVQPGETVRIIGKFDGTINYGDYMYHCHILEHEDAGMMGYFRIGNSGNLDILYPNTLELPTN